MGSAAPARSIAELVSRLGYRVHMYFDYPSLIKGGHNFALVPGMAEQTGAASEKADFLIALNQETIDRHRHRLGETGTIIADSGTTRAGGAIGIPVGEILSSEKAHPVMGNSAMIGAFSRAAGMRWEEVEPVLKVSFPRETDLNLKVARRGYDAVTEVRPLMRIPGPVLPSLTGNEAIALGLV